MTARTYGQHFKNVLIPLMSGEVLFPEHFARVSAMDDATLYPWAEYKRIVSDIGEKLSSRVLRAQSADLMKRSVALFKSQGFETIEGLLSDWDRVMTANVVDIEPQDMAYVVSFEPGTVVIDFSDCQPPDLCEGYLSGAVLAYGGRVTSLKREPVERHGHPFTQFTLRWS